MSLGRLALVFLRFFCEALDPKSLKNSLILKVFENATCWFFEGTDVSLGLILFLFGRYCPKMGSKMVSKSCQKLITKWLKKVFKNWLKSTPENEQK